MVTARDLTKAPAPNSEGKTTYVIMEGSAKGWTITSETPPNGYIPPGTNMVYKPVDRDIIHWETSEAPVGEAVETTITAAEDKEAGTTTYTGTTVDMGHVSSTSTPSGGVEYAPGYTSRFLFQSDPNLPLTKEQIEQQRGVSFSSDWGVVAHPIASTREGTMYGYEFYSISERKAKGIATGQIEEARTDIGKNFALSSMIALRRPENVLTTLYLAGKRPQSILGADNPELEAWREQQATEIVKDITYYQTRGGLGSYLTSTVWESYPTQVMAIPYVGGMAIGKVLNLAFPWVAGAVGSAVTKVSPRVAGVGAKAVGFLEKHPTATTIGMLSPVIYGETKYAYDVGISSMPESQKVGLVGTEFLKTGITLTAMNAKTSPLGIHYDVVPNAKNPVWEGISIGGRPIIGMKRVETNNPPYGANMERIQKVGYTINDIGLKKIWGAEWFSGQTKREIVTGMPNAEKIIEALPKQYTPMSSVQTRVVTESIRTVAPLEAEKMEIGVRLGNFLGGTPRESPEPLKFTRGVERLTPKATENVLQVTKENPELLSMYYGSLSGEAQLLKPYKTPVHDMDIESPNIKMAEKMVKLDLKAIEKGGMKARRSPENTKTFVVEALKEGKYGKALDIHYIGEPISDFDSMLGDNFRYGLTMQKPPVKIEGQTGMFIGEQSQRKLTAGLVVQKTPKGVYVGGYRNAPSEKFKDVASVPKYVENAIVRRQMFRPDSFLESRRVNQAQKDVIRWKELFPEVDWATASAQPLQGIAMRESVRETRSPMPSSLAYSTRMSISPSQRRSVSPSISPSLSPSMSQSISTSISPRISPSLSPSMSQSISTSISPRISPSLSPSMSPSISPSLSLSPSMSPSPSPSPFPSPSISPSPSPSPSPFPSPSIKSNRITSFMFSGGMDFGKREGMFKMPKIERLTKYKPSAIGNVFNIRGRQPKTVTGMEFARPIAPKSRGWLNKLMKV